MTQVVNKHSAPYFDVDISRDSVYGNPWSHKPNTRALYQTKTRRESLQKFLEWFPQQTELVERARKELKDLVIGCTCKPKDCHGDVIAAVVDGRDLTKIFSWL